MLALLEHANIQVVLSLEMKYRAVREGDHGVSNVQISCLEAPRTWLSRQLLIPRIAAVGSTCLAPYRARPGTAISLRISLRN
jgi:hypothetical protein